MNVSKLLLKHKIAFLRKLLLFSLHCGFLHYGFEVGDLEQMLVI